MASSTHALHSRPCSASSDTNGSENFSLEKYYNKPFRLAVSINNGNVFSAMNIDATSGNLFHNVDKQHI